MRKFKDFIIKVPFLYKISLYLIKVKTTGTFRVGILPQSEKVGLLLDYAKKLDCKIFVETGTYKGDTVNSCKDYFDELFSIELSHELFLYCKNKFSGFDKIHIFEGDSERVLPEIVQGINKPILFWLDAHYSGGETARGEQDSPIIKELNYILENVQSFCILIDDARCFNGKNGYPSMKYLKDIINQSPAYKKTPLKLQVRNDIIRICQI